MPFGYKSLEPTEMVAVGEMFKHYSAFPRFTRLEGNNTKNIALEVFNDKSIPMTFLIEASLMTQVDVNIRSVRARFTRTRKMSITENHTPGNPSTDYSTSNSNRVWGRASRVYHNDGNTKTPNQALAFNVSEVVTLQPNEKIYFRWFHSR